MRDRRDTALTRFLAEIRTAVPPDRVLQDEFSTLTHGADASFYSLTPKAVLLVETEQEVVAVCRAASTHRTPITFRAAGTSLSGQAVTHSVLVKLGRTGWRMCEALEGGAAVRVGPAMVAAHVNARLARLGRKIGPDPASLDAAMMGGIAANNSSGMCCGTAHNTYQTLRSMRIVLADGSVLDTADPASRAAFATRRPDILATITQIAAEIRADAALTALIGRKYAIKNTMGYGLNAFVDFVDPIDILQHLMVGSEGTLGFISEITLDTVSEPRLRSAALVLFADMHTACRAAIRLRQSPAAAVELMDFVALATVAGKPGMPGHLRTLAPGAAALLIDVRADDPAQRADGIRRVLAAFEDVQVSAPVAFSSDPVTYGHLWNVRKGLLASIGAIRPAGTTIVVEDVAVPIERLADAAVALREVLDTSGYRNAIIFGHALDGNLHFVFPQSFDTQADIDRYARLAQSLTQLIALEYGGSLKAEHGTGRNMAPFVEMEWGTRAYALMRRVKAAFDPAGVLSPGVLISDDAMIHLRDLKKMPPADKLIDMCIECGFCEPVCPSRALTLTPRQRIVATRALVSGDLGTGQRRSAAFRRAYAYQAVDTCAGDGLCARHCPVGIDTGAAMRAVRHKGHGRLANTVAGIVERHLPLLAGGARIALGAADAAHALLGSSAMHLLSRGARGVGGRLLPGWRPGLPRRGRPPPVSRSHDDGDARPRVVLFTSCASSAMGPSRGAPDQRSLWQVLEQLFAAAGYRVTHVDGARTACCGMPFDSQGFPAQARDSAARLQTSLRLASRDGNDPIVCDTSPCTTQLRDQHDTALTILDSSAALDQFVLPRLPIRRKAGTIALHVTCSTRKLGLEPALLRLARACAQEVIVPDDIDCCGFAGAKGFSTPELTASALRTLAAQLPARCDKGFSTSRTCEIGLTTHSGRHYQSIAYLLAWCCADANGDHAPQTHATLAPAPPAPRIRTVAEPIASFQIPSIKI